MAWTTTELIASVKRRTGMPVAQATFTTAEILSIANEEMQSYVVPLLLKEREDYYTTSYDVTLVDGVLAYSLPPRAIGGKLREIFLMDAQGRPINLPRVSQSQLEYASFGCYFEDNALTLINDGPSSVFRLGVSLRMVYQLRPNDLVETSAAGVISTFNETNRTVTVSSVPAGFSGNTSWDIVRASPGFETIGIGLTGTLSSSTVTFSADLPARLAAGDYLCLREQSPVPQIPPELHPLLAQRVAANILESKQMTEKLGPVVAKLQGMEKDARSLIAPRIDGEASRVVNRRSLHRLRW